MSEKEAKQLVLMSVLVTGLMAIAKEVFKGNSRDLPKMRILIGVLLAGFFLSILADFVPEIAGPFAIAMMIATLFSKDSERVFRRITTIT